MSRSYKFHDNDKLYFVSFAVIRWIDLFIRNEYREIMIESWKYCQQHKGLEAYAWCIMTSHVHMIIGSTSNPLEDIMRDMKSFTSRELRKAIENNRRESRKEWMLWLMQRAGESNPNNIDFQLWQQHNQPIELNTAEKMRERLNYLHNNPVQAGFVSKSEDWLWSSAGDYAGMKGLLDIKLMM
jgi:REP element-mobilizing transposase RayT